MANVEKIKIRNFLVIKEIEIELRKVNILIGSQASGKSVIAKLCYIFRTASDKFLEGIREDLNKRDLDRLILDDFEERFPRYAWEGTAFHITYSIDNIEISFEGIRNKKNKTTLKVSYSKNLQYLFNSKKKLFKSQLEKEKNESIVSRRTFSFERRVLYEGIIDPLRKGDFKRFFSSSEFVPASRTFFANLQKNIFSFMASNLDIDPFLRDFGKLYEASKRWSKDSILSRRKEKFSVIDKVISAILDGKYEFEDDQDWIVKKGKKTNLINASSGQQESLPMLLVLSILPNFERGGNNMFFIEEPEAHLFPTSQSNIVSLLSYLYEDNTSFFLTTHSPYILSALNNHILAGEALTLGKLTTKKFAELNNFGSPIKFSDISAYSINNGKSEYIVDEEYKIIGADVLDDISDHFGRITNSLLDLIND